MRSVHAAEDDPEAFATNMPVLVTGATGFIGAHVVSCFLEVPVRAMVRDLSLAEMFNMIAILKLSRQICLMLNLTFCSGWL